MLEIIWGKRISKNLYLIHAMIGTHKFFLTGESISDILSVFHTYRDEIYEQIQKKSTIPQKAL